MKQKLTTCFKCEKSVEERGTIRMDSTARFNKALRRNHPDARKRICGDCYENETRNA